MSNFIITLCFFTLNVFTLTMYEYHLPNDENHTKTALQRSNLPELGAGRSLMIQYTFLIDQYTIPIQNLYLRARYNNFLIINFTPS